MKKMSPLIIFTIFSFLFFSSIPSFNKAYALCVGFSQDLGCPCVFDRQCSSGYCLWPIAVPPVPAGLCAIRPAAPNPQDLPTPQSVPPAAAPCTAKDSQGRCLTIDTAFGTFNTMPGEFVVKAFSIVLAASGAIAVLLIMRAGYRIMTARGNPEGIQQGREQLIAAIVGLLFLIFSFVFLQVISVDILKIPTSSNRNNIPLNGTCDVNDPRCMDGLVCKYSGAQGQCQKP